MLDHILGVLLFLGIPLLWYSTGWGSLADRYKTNQPPPEIVLKKQSARLMKYTNTRIIDVGIGENGLYMAVDFAFFDKFAPPLLIDWDSINKTEYYVDRDYGECYRIHLVGLTNTIAFTKKTVETLEERFGRNPITSKLG